MLKLFTKTGHLHLSKLLVSGCLDYADCLSYFVYNFWCVVEVTSISGNVLSGDFISRFGLYIDTMQLYSIY